MAKIILLVGASGSGKTTVGKELESIGYQPLVSYTTRPPRHLEVEGQDYYFVDNENFPNNDALVEEITYNGHRYGTSTKELLGKLLKGNVYSSVDKQGAFNIMTDFPNDTIVFWFSISPELMIERMKNRNDRASMIHARLENAYQTGEFDEPEFKHYTIDADTPVYLIKSYIEAMVARHNS